MINRITLLLGGCALALGGVISAELVLHSSDSGSAPKAESLAPLIASSFPDDGFALPPVESFSSTLERPLFVESRRPSAGTDEDSASIPPRKVSRSGADKLVVTGIVIDGDTRMAVINDLSQRRVWRVSQGGRVGDWVLDEVRPDRVVVRSGSQTEVINLWRFEPAPAPRRAAKAAGKRRQTAQQKRARSRPQKK